jgi:hypothetical protein
MIGLRRRAAMFGSSLAYDTPMVLRVALLVLLIGCRDIRPAPQGGTMADAALDPATDGGNAGDGPPVRQPCTASFGNGLTSAYGRLDGLLVAIVPPGTAGCHADATHLHLQVLLAGAIYDVAVNVGTDDATNDVHSAPLDRALADPPWSEGWHTAVATDYATLGVHAADMPLHTRTENLGALISDLATANHISIYATGYDTQDGAHLVHHNGGGHDGMVVTRPLSATAHARLFSFTSQSF